MKNNIHLEKELAEIIVGFRPGGPNEARQTAERWRKTAEAFVTALNGSDAKGLSNPAEIIALIDAYVNVHMRRSQTWRPESIALDALIADKARRLGGMMLAVEEPVISTANPDAGRIRALQLKFPEDLECDL